MNDGTSGRTALRNAPPDLLTTRDAADLLGVSGRMLRIHAERGDITAAYRVGRSLLWDRADVLALLAARDARGLRTPWRNDGRGPLPEAGGRS